MDNQEFAYEQNKIRERLLDEMQDELKEIAQCALREAIESVDKDDIKRHVCDMEVNRYNVREIFEIGLIEYRKKGGKTTPTLGVIGTIFNYAITELTSQAVEKLDDAELEL